MLHAFSMRPTGRCAQCILHKRRVMNQLTQLIDRYIDTWNELDAKRRKDLIRKTWTDTATYVDPALQAEGQAGIDTMIQGVQARFPGFRFRRTSEVETHHDRIRFTWELGPEGAQPVVKGTDFGVVAPGDRLHAVTGFFDHVAQQ
jgi:hypothetical protein